MRLRDDRVVQKMREEKWFGWGINFLSLNCFTFFHPFQWFFLVKFWARVMVLALISRLLFRLFLGLVRLDDVSREGLESAAFLFRLQNWVSTRDTPERADRSPLSSRLPQCYEQSRPVEWSGNADDASRDDCRYQQRLFSIETRKRWVVAEHSGVVVRKMPPKARLSDGKLIKDADRAVIDRWSCLQLWSPIFSASGFLLLCVSVPMP